MRLGHQWAGFPVLLIAAATASAAAPNFKEGEWGTRYRMEAIGTPFPMPPITVRKSACLTRAHFVPDNAQQGQECQVTNTHVQGNTVTWKMTCKTGQGRIEGDARITFKGTRYDGAMDSRVVNNAGATAMTYRYAMDGQWLGPCDK